MSESTEWLKSLEQVDRRVASTVEKVVQDLRDLASAAEDEAVGQLLAATARVDGESSQGEVLTALLEEGRRFASRTAFFLTRPEEVRGWAGRGFGSGAAPIEGARFGYEQGGAWARLAANPGAVGLNGEECAAVCRALEAPPGSQGVLIPFILRGQLGGALYADRLDGESALGVASLQLLTHTAAQTIETAAAREGGRSPTLRSSTEIAAEDRPVSLWQPPAEEKEPDSAAAVASAAAVVAGTSAAVGAISALPDDQEAAPGEAVVDEAAPGEAVIDEVVEAVVDEVAVDEEPAAEAEVEEPEEEAAAEEGEPRTEAVDFEMVSTDEAEEPLPAIDAEEVTAEVAAAELLEPEPELEDTDDLWAEDDEEPTYVGPAPGEEAVEDRAPAAAAPPEVGQETVRLDVAALQDRVPEAPASEEETAKLPQWEVEPAPEPRAAEELKPEGFELEPEPDEPVTEAMPSPDFSEAATIVSPQADLGSPEPSPAAGGYVPPVLPEVAPPKEVPPPPSAGFAAPPAKAEATGTTQVVPPTDIQGPGSAFGSGQGIPEGEEALHEEARRLARLLVSEIKLYNEEIIEEGRRAGNVYDRLKDDIDRSRQMYEERIDPRLHESGIDYFHQELVQRLAGGDEKLLGY